MIHKLILMLIELYKILKIVVSYIPDGRSVVGPSLWIFPLVYLLEAGIGAGIFLAIKKLRNNADESN